MKENKIFEEVLKDSTLSLIKLFEDTIEEAENLIIKDYEQSLSKLHKKARLFLTRISESNDMSETIKFLNTEEALRKYENAIIEFRQAFDEIRPELIEELRRANEANIQNSLNVANVNRYVDNASLLLQGLQIAINHTQNELDDIKIFLNKVSQSIDDLHDNTTNKNSNEDIHHLPKLV
ncbi:hypothetical protein R84B8_02507 [Treponema sp. R8-4-B8]